MLLGPDIAAELKIDALPLLPGAARLLATGERSTFHDQNRLNESELSVGAFGSLDTRVEILFDPQTAGGLLVVLPVEQASSAVERLRAVGFEDAALVGQLVDRSGGPSVRLV
jgi:selenide,water dikinase